MTYRYGSEEEKKRGPRWMITHCGICGDPHPKYVYGVGERGRGLCPCTEGLQSSRRYVREVVVPRELRREELRLAAAQNARLPKRPPRTVEDELGA